MRASVEEGENKGGGTRVAAQVTPRPNEVPRKRNRCCGGTTTTENVEGHASFFPDPLRANQRAGTHLSSLPPSRVPVFGLGSARRAW